MNSAEIKSREHAVYRAFAENTRRASAPGVFFWVGEHAVLSGGVAICQQIPLRVHVGIRRSRQSDRFDLTFKKSGNLWYDRTRAAAGGTGFSEMNITDETETLICHVLRLAAELGRESLNLHDEWEVSSISEVRPSAGANWSGAFSSALAAVLMLEAGLLSEDSPSGWAHEPVRHLLRPGHPFRRCHELAWRLEQAFHHGNASGYGTMCSLLPEAHPILYSARIVRDADTHEPCTVMPGRDDPGRIYAYNAIRLREVLGEPPSVSHPVLPGGILCGLIYSGTRKNTGDSIDSTEEAAKRLGEALSDLIDVGGRHFANLAVGSSSPLLVELDGTRGDRVLESERRPISLAGSLVLSGMRSLYARQGAPDGPVADLTEGMRRAQGALRALGVDWPGAARIEGLIYQVAGTGGFARTAVKLTGGGRGGSLLFAALPTGSGTPVWHRIEQSLASLVHDADTDPPSMDWCNYRDGLGSRDGNARDRHGLRLEVRQEGGGVLS